MKKIISMLAMLFLFCNISTFAQSGRPEPIGNNAPKITARNSLDKDVATLAERMTTLENRMAALEADNYNLKAANDHLKADCNALKAENASQQKQISDQATAITANYKILENYVTNLKNKFDTQVGTFRITGAISNKSLGTNGSVNLLMGTHE